jgi:hypothetical protein
MRPAVAALFLLAAPALMGCPPSLIPGTEVKDTPETRAILEVVAGYKNALETKSVDGVMKLVSKTFFETSGTPEGNDDYDFAGLENKLKEWAAQTKSVKVTLEIRDVVTEVDSTRVRYFYDSNFQIPGPDNTLLWKHDSDTKEMTLKREAGVWRITGGI